MNFVVTGGSSGVGAALVSRITAAGHQVSNLDVQAPAEDIAGSQFVQVDLSDTVAIEAAVQSLPATIDGLANVAGIARAADPVVVLAVNFLGLRHLTEMLSPRIKPGGSVVSVSSIAGWDWQNRVDRVAPLLASQGFVDGRAWCEAHSQLLARDPYTFSKRCVSAWVASKAQEFRQTGVRYNTVSPGGIDTPLFPQFEELMGTEHSNWEVAQVGRRATPEDIAQALDMLLTSEVAWLNGADVPVDGGYTAGLASGWIDFSESPAMQAVRARKEG